MRTIKKILVVQTSFIGDVVLLTPLLKEIRSFFPSVNLDVMVTPRAAPVLQNNPSVTSVVTYDKRGTQRGLRSFCELVRRLRVNRYELTFVPHRSIRSALLVWLAGIPLRIGFTKSAGRYLFTKRVWYDADQHEIDRNLSLLSGIGIDEYSTPPPIIQPSDEDIASVDNFLVENATAPGKKRIAVAPGSIWFTKRWLPERFADLARRLAELGWQVMLIGGTEDKALCDDIARQANTSEGEIVSSAGQLSLTASAELIRRCELLVSNDSAPMHLASAVGTPVIAIYGATVPEFGFAPRGKKDRVVQTRGLRCRPCSIHGGQHCPIKTFDCMKNISVEKILRSINEITTP